MLMDVRDKIRGWIAYVIIGLISIPFVLWGVGEYFSGPGDREIASIEGKGITVRELNNAVSERRQQIVAESDGQVTAEMFAQMDLHRQVLDQMINEELLDNYIRAQGFSAPDALVIQAIRSIDAFQQNGEFDRQLYETLVTRQGMSLGQFEHSVRQDIALRTLDNALGKGVISVEPEVNQFIALAEQQRELGLLRIDRDVIAQMIDRPDEADLRAYFEAHERDFYQPEQVKLAYLELSPDTLAVSQEITEEQLYAAYEDYLRQQRAQIERSVRHILVDVSENASPDEIAAARQQIDEARAKIESDELTFAEAAAAYSTDRSSAESGGDLGTIRRGDMVENFENAMVRLDVGQISSPIRTRFGWHLLEVTDQDVPEMDDFEEMREQLRAEVGAQQAERALFESIETLANLAFEQPASLIPAAEQLDLDIQHTDWITRQQGEGLAQDRLIRTAAFSSDVLDERVNSELIELADNRVAVVRVEEHQPAQPRSFDAVRDEVERLVIQERTNTLAAELAEDLRDQLAAGEDYQQFAERDYVRITPLEFYRRGQFDADLPPVVVDRGFNLAPGSSGMITTVVELDNHDLGVVLLAGVKPGDPAEIDLEVREQLKFQMQQEQGNRLVQAFIDSLRARSDVDIDERALAQLSE